MIKKHEETVTITQSVEDAVQCDVCNKEFLRNDWEDLQEMVHIRSKGGYGSIFGDGSDIELDICQYCLKEKLGPWLRIGESELDRMAASVGFDTQKRDVDEKDR